MTAVLAVLGGMPAAEADRADGPQRVDDSVRPGDDFYRYANGVWLKATPIPVGRASYDTTAMLRDESAGRVRALIEEADKASSAGRPSQVGDYYASWMDLAGIESKGLQPIAGDLAAIAAIKDRGTLSTYLGRAMRLDDGTNTQTDGLFGVWIHQGFHDSTHYAAHLLQGGLGLPDREIYLDPGKVSERELYRAHIGATLKLAGFDRPDDRAARVLAIEVAIAGTHASRADTDDVFKTDNVWRVSDLATKAPGLDWTAFFDASGLSKQDIFVVWQPSAIIGSAALVGSQPVEAWKDYLAFRHIEHYAASLPKAFGEEDIAFLGLLTAQTPSAQDRIQQAIDATTAALGDAIGRLYVEKYFPPKAKAAAKAMAQNILKAFRARVEGLTWMSSETRRTALTKLATVKAQVGYPDTWIDYSDLEVRRDDAYGNMRRAEAFAYRRELAKLGQPVETGEWSQLLPQKVGAVIYFSPNTLQFSAGLLQPPYFDEAGDAAANYGSAGAGMAHEISHIFDELGSIYDAEGRLSRWWTPDDLARYQAASLQLTAQYEAYCPEPDHCLNGKQVQGESIADLAGLLVAHDAYVLSLGGKPDQIEEGITGDQRFFLSFARRWRKVLTDEALGRQIATDSHAPSEYRADTVRNVEAWQRAFNVRPGDRLYVDPKDRVKIW